MYKITVPLMLETVNDTTKHEFLEQLKKAKADRITLSVNFVGASEVHTQNLCDKLASVIGFFGENGIDTGVWISHSIGMGLDLALPGLTNPNGREYARLVDLSGVEHGGTRCPTDALFRADFAHFVAMIAKTGAKFILLDDDFRFSLRGKELMCACDAHMARICELCGETLDRQTLKEKAFTGKPNKYRSAWLRAQGDSLREFAREIRAAVDEVDPSVCLALCASHSVDDIDGTSAAELTKILAGSCEPQMRIHGAPYWEIHWPKPLPAVFEYVRCFSRMAKAEGVDLLMAEGDCYPRPRFNTPSSHLELFDALNRADGTCGGILKYMMDYNATPSYETGYVRRHIHNFTRMEELEAMFAGKRDCGVEVPLEPHMIENADLDVSVLSDQYPYPSAASLLAMASIPTSCDGDGICQAIFGENARYASDAALEKGALIDGVAAVILMQKGVDVGLSGSYCFEEGRPSYGVSPDGKDRSWIISRGTRFLSAEIHPSAEVVMYADDGGKLRPLIYRYENENGQRFLVYMTDPMAKLYNHEICKGYLMQKALKEGVEWIAGKRLPAVCLGNPSLYLLCKRDECKMAVGLFNCFADSVLEPTVKLDGEYRKVRFVGCNGRLEGDTVYLDAPLSAFDFAAFEVET